MGKYVIKVRVSYRDYGSSFKIHYKTFNPYGRLNPIEIYKPLFSMKIWLSFFQMIADRDYDRFSLVGKSLLGY
jgi:hypothetical protein